MAVIPSAVIAAAQASQAKYGIPASVSAAQWALESEWGRSMPGGLSSNNPFGIKAVGDQPRVTAMTSEFLHGRWLRMMQPFRKFASLNDAFEAHAKLLAEGKPYVNARKKLPDANAFADALTGVYATAPNYGAVLKAIMRSHGLQRYDVAGTAPVSSAAPRVLREGDSGPEVVKLQQALATHGLSINLTVDGVFGQKTDAAVRALQRFAGLVEDGIVGSKTRATLGL